MICRRLNRAEIPGFLSLVWNVFCEFGAPNYPEQAKMIFKSAIYDKNYLAMLDAYGAYEDDVPIGIIATRSEGKHLALFFVDGKYHKQGIGKQLWNVMLSENPNHELTVHSSLYAIPVYERLGFVKMGEMQTEDGITYLPMMFKRSLPAN